MCTDRQTDLALREAGDADHAHDGLAVDVVQTRPQPVHLLAGLRHAVPHVLCCLVLGLGQGGGLIFSCEWRTAYLEGGQRLEEVLGAGSDLLEEARLHHVQVLPQLLL